LATSGFQDLDVWRSGIELAKQVFELTRTFPENEGHTLGEQMQQAAIAIPSNIAEAHTRASIFHLSAARGSLSAVETMLMLAQELQYCKAQSPVAQELAGLCSHVNEKMNSLQKKLNERSGSSV
jgi:four helix bundle protein